MYQRFDPWTTKRNGQRTRANHFAGARPRVSFLPTTPFPLPRGLGRVLLVVDGENLAIACENAGLRLSEDYLLTWLRANCDEAGILCFMAEDSEGPMRFEHEDGRGIAKFVKPARSHGSFNADVEIALVLAHGLMPGDMDGVIIGSGDADLLPLCGFLKEQGFRVGVLSVSGSTSHVLRRQPDIGHAFIGRDLVVPIGGGNGGRP